jgi:hypothetical protein
MQLSSLKDDKRVITKSRTEFVCSCARVITGIGTGQLNALVPVWTSELSHHSGRGAAMGFECEHNLLHLLQQLIL